MPAIILREAIGKNKERMPMLTNSTVRIAGPVPNPVGVQKIITGSTVGLEEVRGN